MTETNEPPLARHVAEPEATASPPVAPEPEVSAQVADTYDDAGAVAEETAAAPEPPGADEASAVARDATSPAVSEVAEDSSSEDEAAARIIVPEPAAETTEPDDATASEPAAAPRERVAAEPAATREEDAAASAPAAASNRLEAPADPAPSLPGEDAETPAPEAAEARQESEAAAPDEAPEPGAVLRQRVVAEVDAVAATDEAPEAGAGPAPEVAPEPEVEVPLAASAVPFAAAKEANNPVEGKVIGWNAGGFHVASDGVTAFCPRSLMELGNRPKPPANYVNNTYQFHVLEIRDTGRRIVLTRRPAIRSERKRGLDEVRAKLSSREPVTGRVSSVTDFGAFIDLGNGLGGLVHRTQISRIRSGEPADLLKVGDEVQAVVTKIEPRSGKRGVRISLSMKALEADPWKETVRQFTAGDRFTGKVARHTDFGIFVELAPGLDGLVHSSRLPVGKTMSAPEFKQGAEIAGWVVEVEPKRRRIALSLRETPTTDPWKPLAKQYAEGAEVQGRVEQVSRFGVFVELEPGLTGLLPMSSLKLPDGAQANRTYPPGREIKVVIESIDRKRRRLGLAPPGSQLVGNKADYKQYRQRQKKDTGLNVMAAAFAKLQDPR